MMKKLFFMATLLVAALSFGQTTTEYSFEATNVDSGLAVNELVIGTNGVFYDRDGGGVLTTAQIKITSVTTFDAAGATAFDNFQSLSYSYRDANDNNTFIFQSTNNGMKENNETDRTGTVGDGNTVTRTWERTFMTVEGSPVVGENVQLKRSGGAVRDGGDPQQNIGTVTFNSFPNNVLLPVVTPLPDPPKINITLTQPPTKIGPASGTLDQSLIFTISNIPANTAATCNSRLYKQGTTDINGGGQIGQSTATLSINSADADVDNADITTTSTAVTDGYFDRTFTIKNYTMSGAPDAGNTSLIIGLRFVFNSENIVFDDGISLTSNASATKQSFHLVPSVALDTTLSLNDNIIEGAKVYAKNGNIYVSGANLDAVYAITGQKVGSENLTSGIYIAKISKDAKVATVKVAL